MADMNTVCLMGHLTRDAEIKYTNSGMAICEFALAINTRRKQGEEWVDEANFFDITLFGRQGEAIQRYLTKGKQVGVTGRLKQERWQNKEGQNRSKIKVIADNVTLAGGSDREAPARSAPRNQSPRRTAAVDSQADFEDEVPF